MSEVRDLVERLYDLIVRGVGGVSSSASSSSAGLGGSDGISFGYVKTWIHVSPDGVDTATGSVDDPVLTLGRAADLANGAVGTAGISLIGDIYPSGHVVGRLRNTVITGSAGAIVRGGVHIPVSQLERRADGIYEYRLSGANVLLSGVWCGWCVTGDGLDVFLPRYRGLSDLQKVRQGKFSPAVPPRGVAVDGATLYVLGDISGTRFVNVSPLSGPAGIVFEDARNVVLDGIRFEGLGGTRCVEFSERCSNVCVQNCEFLYSREGVRVPDRSTVGGCTYGSPGFRDFAVDVAERAGGNFGAFFDYVKKYNHDPKNTGNAYYEGRLATSMPRKSSRYVLFEANRVGDCFDGHSLGQFRDSRIANDVGNGCLDDWCEFESWRKTHTGANLSVDRCTLIDCMSSFSHQDNVGQSMGPVHVNGCMVLNVGKYFTAPYIIKNLTKNRSLPKVKARYDRCFFFNRVGVNQWGSGVSFVYLDHKKGEWIDLSIRDSIIVVDEVDDWDRGWDADCDWNVLVCMRDYPHIRGPHGMWVRSIRDLALSGNFWRTADRDVHFVEPSMLDVRPTETSPHIGRGSDGVTPGIYEPGDALIDNVFSRSRYECEFGRFGVL